MSIYGRCKFCGASRDLYKKTCTNPDCRDKSKEETRESLRRYYDKIRQDGIKQGKEEEIEFLTSIKAKVIGNAYIRVEERIKELKLKGMR